MKANLWADRMGDFYRLLDECAGSVVIGAFVVVASSVWFMAGLGVGSLAGKIGATFPKWLDGALFFSWIVPPVLAFGVGLVYVFARPLLIVAVHFLPFLGEQFVIADGGRVPASGQYPRATEIFDRMRSFYASMGLAPLVAGVGAWLSWGAALIGNVAAYNGLYKWIRIRGGLKSPPGPTQSGLPGGEEAPSEGA